MLDAKQGFLDGLKRHAAACRFCLFENHFRGICIGQANLKEILPVLIRDFPYDSTGISRGESPIRNILGIVQNGAAIVDEAVFAHLNIGAVVTVERRIQKCGLIGLAGQLIHHGTDAVTCLYRIVQLYHGHTDNASPKDGC